MNNRKLYIALAIASACFYLWSLALAILEAIAVWCFTTGLGAKFVLADVLLYLRFAFWFGFLALGVVSLIGLAKGKNVSIWMAKGANAGIAVVSLIELLRQSLRPVFAYAQLKIHIPMWIYWADCVALIGSVILLLLLLSLHKMDGTDGTYRWYHFRRCRR